MGTHVLSRPRTILAAVALLSALTLLFSSVPLATATASDDGLQRESDTVQSAATSAPASGGQGNTCNQLGFVKIDRPSGNETFNFGQLVWSGTTLTYTLNPGWSVELCVKGGDGNAPPHTFTATTSGSYTHTGGISHIGWKNPNPPEEVTPVEPTIVRAEECGVPDTLTIPTTTGVIYKVDGDVVADGTVLEGALSGTVTAVAAAGYVLSESLSFPFVLAAAEECPEEVTPVEPTIVRAAECGVPDTLTIPDVDGVQYRVNGQNVSAGHVVSGFSVGLVTAFAEPGFVLTNPTWPFSFAVYPFLLKGAKDCPVEVEPLVFTEADCDSPATLTVPEVENITYLLDGDDVSGDTIEGPLVGTINVVPDPGFKLDGPSSFQFDLADADDCVQAEPALVTAADCDNPEVLSIPATEGVVYLVDGVDVSGTTIEGPGEVVVTAVAAEGFVLVDGEGAVITELVSTFDLADADDCPDFGDDDGDDVGDDDDGDVGAGDDNGDADEGDDDGDEVTDDDGDDDGDDTDVLPTPPVSPSPTPTQPPVAQAPAPPTPGTGLAATGGDLMLLLFAGLVALSLGVLSLMVGRRRTSRVGRYRA